MQKFIDNGPDQKDLDKYKEGEYNDDKDNLKSNSYWMSNIAKFQHDDTNKYEILDYQAEVKALTVKDLQNVAKKYLTKNRTTAVLMPEDGWKEAAEAAKKEMKTTAVVE